MNKSNDESNEPLIALGELIETSYSEMIAETLDSIDTITEEILANQLTLLNAIKDLPLETSTPKDARDTQAQVVALGLIVAIVLVLEFAILIILILIAF